MLIEGNFPAQPDGINGAAQVAVFMEDALGVSGGAGGVDGIGRVVLIRHFIAGKRRGVHHLRPVVRVQLKPATAVLPDVVDPLRRVGILHQGPGCAGFPDADHGNDRHDAPGQVQQHKVLPADAVLLQESINFSAHLFELGIGDALAMGIVKQDCFIRLPGSVLFQLFNDVIHMHPSQFISGLSGIFKPNYAGKIRYRSRRFLLFPVPGRVKWPPACRQGADAKKNPEPGGIHAGSGRIT